MNNIKTIPLKKISTYSDSRIKCSTLDNRNYVGTDNLLQNKYGKVDAQYTPKMGSTTGYLKGDILIGNIRPYLKKIWYATNSGGSSPDVLTLRVNEQNNSKFVYYSLLRDDFFNYVMIGSKGTKMPRGDKNQVLDFIIPDFDIKNQDKIASVLSALDSKIEINNCIGIELEKMAKMLYDYWFVQFDFPNKKNKPYKSGGGKMIFSEDLNKDIPEGWSVETLLDIAEYTNGLPCQKYRPNGNDSLRVIKIKEMHDGFSSESELVGTDIPSKVIVENGDILFSWSASLEVMMWSKGKGALNQHIFKVTSKEYPKYFYYFQLLNYLQHFKMMAENRKTTMGHITQEHLLQSRIAVPPKHLVDKLDDIISPIFDMKLSNEIENQKLIELRDWLLPMLMNGQIKVR